MPANPQEPAARRSGAGTIAAYGAAALAVTLCQGGLAVPGLVRWAVDLLAG